MVRETGDTEIAPTDAGNEIGDMGIYIFNESVWRMYLLSMADMFADDWE